MSESKIEEAILSLCEIRLPSVLVREIDLIKKIIEKSERGYRLGINSYESLSTDISRTILDLLKVCDYIKYNYDELKDSKEVSNCDLEVGGLESLMNISNISKKTPDSIILEVLNEVIENISISLLKDSQYKHYPKLIVNLLNEVDLKESSARGELKNISSKVAELYYYLESKLNEKREVNYFLFKKTKEVLKKGDRFLHRVEFLKLALIRKSISTYLEEVEMSEKYRNELYTVKDEVAKDVVLYLEQKSFVFNKRPVTPVSPVYYHFNNAYNGVPVSVISEFTFSLKKYKFYRLTPFDFQVKITESYDSDGLVENIIYDFRMEKEVMRGFAKKIDLLL